MRRESVRNSLFVLALVGILEPTLAFTTILRRSTIGCPTFELNLVPGQGNQLVAAYNAATCKKEQEYDDDLTPAAPSSVTVQESPRTFVKRVFHLPSVRRHPHPKAEGLDTHSESDVVYYPMIGFTFCRNGDRVIALPTKSNVSCRLTPSREQEVYGWFSPVCKLDLYSDDPCRNPNDDKGN